MCDLGRAVGCARAMPCAAVARFASLTKRPVELGSVHQTRILI